MENKEKELKNNGLNKEKLEKLKSNIKKATVREFKNLGFSEELAVNNIENIYQEYLYLLIHFSKSSNKNYQEQYKSLIEDFKNEKSARGSLYTVLGSIIQRGEHSNDDLLAVSNEILKKKYEKVEEDLDG